MKLLLCSINQVQFKNGKKMEFRSYLTLCIEQVSFYFTKKTRNEHTSRTGPAPRIVCSMPVLCSPL